MEREGEERRERERGGRGREEGREREGWREKESMSFNYTDCSTHLDLTGRQYIAVIDQNSIHVHVTVNTASLLSKQSAVTVLHKPTGMCTSYRLTD